MASLRRRLVIPTALAVSLLGGAAASFIGCSEDSSGDDEPTPVASDVDAGNGDATTIDAVPMPDSAPDARPDAPVG